MVPSVRSIQIHLHLCTACADIAADDFIYSLVWQCWHVQILKLMSRGDDHLFSYNLIYVILVSSFVKRRQLGWCLNFKYATVPHGQDWYIIRVHLCNPSDLSVDCFDVPVDEVCTNKDPWW